MAPMLPSRRFSFLEKLLALACCITVVVVYLMGLALWIVNRQFTARYEKEVKQTLRTAEAVFQHTRDSRIRHLRSRNQQASNEPRIRALTHTDPATVGHVLREDLLGEQSLDNTIDEISFSDESARFLSSAAVDPALDLTSFEAGIYPAVKRALAEGDPQNATILVGNRMFDVVATPIMISGQAAGVLSFAVEVGGAVAKEFKRLTQSEITFVANGREVASTITDPSLRERLADMFSQSLVRSLNPSLRPIELNGEHFLGIAGKFREASANQVLGYLMLFSYEEALADLRAMRSSLLVVGVLGTLLSGLIAWFVVRRITEPLRQLRCGAEAVERGDLSYQVPITSHDEFGELGSTFNRMTGSLKSSREELERTVETLQKTQTQLVQREKLSAIGQFVAGVAHELNNPLTSVIGYADLIKTSPISQEDRENLEQVIQNADRCAKIVRNLLSFARQSPPTRKPVNVNQILEDTLRLFGSRLKTRIVRVSRHLDPGLPLTLADPAQIQQVFFNIINNALQAMQSRQAEGELRITTDVASGKVRVTFADDGPGISQQNLSKLFTPFYTTKDVGQGIGLGLSVSYGIIKEHGGDISVRSEPGQGASFIVELPAPTNFPQPDLEVSSPDEEAEFALNGHEKKVLVVDDEVSIGGLVQQLLVPLGFRVTTTNSAEAALSMLRVRKFDLVLCDCKMPGIGGAKLYEQVRVSYPELASRFLYMTGDVFNATAQEFMRKYNLPCLPKPFTADELKSALSKLTF